MLVSKIQGNVLANFMHPCLATRVILCSLRDGSVGVSLSVNNLNLFLHTEF